MTTIHPGEFWVADVPFTNTAVTKKRPVLVLWLDGADVVVAAVTTAGPRNFYDVPLADWKTSGLVRASTIRLSRLDCLERRLLIARIGLISESDGERLKQIWSLHIKPRF
jgi:mRNA interferase MazF